MGLPVQLVAKVFWQGGKEKEYSEDVRLGGKDNLCAKTFIVIHYLFLKKKGIELIAFISVQQ